MFYVNLRNMQDNPTYELEALAHHEGIPGHHMQIAIAQELNGIPKFRKFSRAYTAYTEGWGLYSELTPKEIGLYADPYSDFGRLSLELWRAGRLVVDTGIHSKRWTREQAIDYPDQKHAKRRGGLHRLDQSLHRNAEPGDRLQGGNAEDSRTARKSEKVVRRYV
jgi:uncharacterized protein (DUF885 family)